MHVVFFRVQKYYSNLVIMSYPFRFGLVLIPMVCDSRKKSPIELNPPFTIISIVTTFVAVLTSLVLIFAKYYLKISWMWYICLTIVKCIGLFGMYAANLSLVMVVVVPPNYNSIGYMLVFLIFGYAIAYYFIWHLDNTVDSGATDAKIFCLGLFYIPLSLMLAFFLPEHLDWIFISILIVFSCLETTTNSIFYYSKKGETNNASKLEAHHQDKINDLPLVDYSCMI